MRRKVHDSTLPNIELHTKIRKLLRSRKEIEREMQMLITTAQDLMTTIDDVDAEGDTSPTQDRLNLTALNVNVLDVGVVLEEPVTAPNAD